MPRECGICSNAKRGDIERALVAGDSINAVAEAFKGAGMSRASLQRHVNNHMERVQQEPKVAKSSALPPLSAADAAALGSVDAQIRQLAETAQRLRKHVEDGGEGVTLVQRGQVLGQCRTTIEAMAELDKERRKGRDIELLKSPEWSAVRATLLEALMPFPDARAAAVEALREHEAAA